MGKSRGLVVVTAALVIAGCGSSNTTTSAKTSPSTQASVPSTPAPPPKPKTPKELAEERAAAHRKAAEERAEAHKRAAEEAATQREDEKQAAADAREAKAKEATAAASSNAKKLVEVWKDEPVEASDSNVVSIEQHLLSLGRKCEQSIPTLAGEINSGVEITKKEGLKETPVSLAAAYDKAAPGKSVTAECRGVFAALLVLIEKGE